MNAKFTGAVNAVILDKTAEYREDMIQHSLLSKLAHRRSERAANTNFLTESLQTKLAEDQYEDAVDHEAKGHDQLKEDTDYKAADEAGTEEKEYREGDRPGDPRWKDKIAVQSGEPPFGAKTAPYPGEGGGDDLKNVLKGMGLGVAGTALAVGGYHTGKAMGTRSEKKRSEKEQKEKKKDKKKQKTASQHEGANMQNLAEQANAVADRHFPSQQKTASHRRRERMADAILKVAYEQNVVDVKHKSENKTPSSSSSPGMEEKNPGYGKTDHGEYDPTGPVKDKHQTGEVQTENNGQNFTTEASGVSSKIPLATGGGTPTQKTAALQRQLIFSDLKESIRNGEIKV
jgi:hypothetical protein